MFALSGRSSHSLILALLPAELSRLLSLSKYDYARKSYLTFVRFSERLVAFDPQPIC